MRYPWIALVVLSTALAGCSDGGGEKADPASLCDGIYEDGVCTPHVEPHVVVEGLPDSFSAYSRVTFTWRLDNGTRGEPGAPVHSMDSRIKVATESTTVSNATGPDEWGQDVAREQHQNLPGSFEATLSWDEPSTLYLKGYMQIDGENVWTDLGMVDVTPVQPTGNATVIKITGPPQAQDRDQVSVTVGDTVEFQNDSPVDYTALITCGDVELAPVAVGADASGETAPFLAPGSCSYILHSAFGDYGVDPDPLELSGDINVNAP